MKNNNAKQKKLTIAFLDFDDIKNPLLGGGQARATMEVGKRLIKKGHKVLVLCSRYPGYKDRIENGIEYKHIGLGSKNIRLNNAIYIVTVQIAVSKIKNADIIVECFTAPISTLFSPLFTKIPVIGLSTSFEAERFSKLYHLPFRHVEHFGLRFYKYYVALSDYFDEKMKQENPSVYSTVIPEGVCETFFRISKKSPKHILFLARLDMGQKGIDLLLQAYSKIAAKATYPLVIAGNGPDEKKIKELIQKLGLEKKVSMIGPAWGKKKEKYLARALYVAFPSRNETFSCFALESLASGLPLVAFDIPGIRWSGNVVAKKVTAFDVDAYAKLLLSSMDRSEMESLGKKARKFASSFTWESVSDQFERFFYEILEKEKLI